MDAARVANRRRITKTIKQKGPARTKPRAGQPHTTFGRSGQRPHKIQNLICETSAPWYALVGVDTGQGNPCALLCRCLIIRARETPVCNWSGKTKKRVTPCSLWAPGSSRLSDGQAPFSSTHSQLWPKRRPPWFNIILPDFLRLRSRTAPQKDPRPNQARRGSKASEAEPKPRGKGALVLRVVGAGPNFKLVHRRRQYLYKTLRLIKLQPTAHSLPRANT
jgi:hypothetical protein